MLAPSDRQLVIAARIYCLVTAQEWTQASALAKQAIDELRLSGDRERLRDACYEYSLIASHAGEHGLSMQWIDEATSLYGATVNALDVKLKLHSRRGYAHLMAEQPDVALNELIAACAIARDTGNIAAFLRGYRDAISAVNQDFKLRSRLEELEPTATAYAGDDKDNDKLYQALDSAEEGRDYDALSKYLIAFHQALAQSSFSTMMRVQKRLGEFFSKRGLFWQALHHHFQCGHTEAVISLCERAVPDINQDGARMICQVVRSLGSTSWARACVGATVQNVADVIPDDEVVSVFDLLIKHLKRDGRDSESAASLLGALSEFKGRVSVESAKAATELALSCIKQDEPGLGQVRGAAIRVLEAFVGSVETPLQLEVVDTLLANSSDWESGSKAIRGMAFIGEGAVPAVRERVSGNLAHLAAQKKVDACRYYAGLAYGHLPSDASKGIVEWYINAARDMKRMIEEHHWHMNRVYNLRSIASVADYIQPDQASTFFHLLIELVGNKDNLLTCRSDAAATFEALSDLIPTNMVELVVNVLTEVAHSESVGGVIQLQTGIAESSFGRFKVNCGDIATLKQAAYISLGRVGTKLRGATLRDVANDILAGTGHELPEVRVGTAIGLKNLQPALGASLRTAAIAQLYVLLHDSSLDVRQAATYALIDYVDHLSGREAEYFLKRLLVLRNGRSVGLRLNVLRILNALRTHYGISKGKQLIEDAVQEHTRDLSHRVREAAAELTLASETT